MKTTETSNRAWNFFLLAYAITWGLSALVTYLPVPSIVKGLGSVILHYGPTLAAIILAGIHGELKRLFSGLGKWRAGIQWYLFVFLFPVGAHLLAVGFDTLLGGTLPTFFSANEVPAGNPWLLIVPIFLVIFLQAGLAEEIGWRGYALPRLQTRYNAITSSLILGVMWTFWHYHPQNITSLRELGPWYMFAVIPLTIIMTWIYNNTEESVLLLALFHTVSNVTDWIAPIHPGITSVSGMRPFMLYGGVLWVFALALLGIYGAENLKLSEPKGMEAQ